MTQLNKHVAILKGIKSHSYRDLTKDYQAFQKPELLTGLSRQYRPKDEEGDRLPAEDKRIQVRVEDGLREVAQNLTELFDITATIDFGNQSAKADVVVDGHVLVKDAPVPYLLFLEKQLTDIDAFVSKLPVLDPADKWKWSEEQNCWMTEPVETHRTKKVKRALVKFPATKEHPAQTETYDEDIIVGYWSTMKYSAAVPATRVKEMSERVQKLLRAVKMAREQANMTEIPPRQFGRAIFDYILEGK